MVKSISLNLVGHQLTLSVSLLVILLVFSLLLAEQLPSTSLSVPLVNRYLLFTLCQVTLSVLLSVLVIRVADRCTAPGLPSRLLLRYLSDLLKIGRLDCVAPSDRSGSHAFLNASTTNSTARSSISGFCHPSSACQSLVAKYQLEGSQSELASRLVQSRRSTVEEDDERPNTASHSSTTSKSTKSSERSSSSSSGSRDSFERNRLKKESSFADLKNDDDLENRLRHNDPHSTRPRRPPEFEKAVLSLNLLERNARNEQLHSKVRPHFLIAARLR